MMTKKAELSNQTLGVLLVVAITLSLIGTFISVTKVGQVPTIRLIGYAIEQNISQAIVNLTVDQVLDINFTTANIDCGIGSVVPGTVNCTLYMNSSPNENCVGFNDLTSLDLIIENIGNQNVTINISFDKNAASFIGGTSPGFEFEWISAEDAACRNTTGTAQSWTATPAIDHNLEATGGWVWNGGYYKSNAIINTTNDYTICPNLDYAEATDTLAVAVKLIIPEDSFTGNLSTTVTATAYVIDCQLSGNCD